MLAARGHRDEDAVDSSELTRLDLEDAERKYGFPYMVIHRSDLHGIFLRACRRAGVELLTDQATVDFQYSDRGEAPEESTVVSDVAGECRTQGLAA